MNGVADPARQILVALDHVAALIECLRLDLVKLEAKLFAERPRPDRKRHRTEYMRLYMRKKRAQQGKAHNGERNGAVA